jgi:CheY-like chemotaxis protein
MIKILIIDNDDLLLQVIEFQDHDTTSLDISIFPDGRSVMDYLMSHRRNNSLLPDVILLNLDIPSMSGWDFLHASDLFFPLLEKKISIIATGYDVGIRDQQRALYCSYVDHFIPKTTYINMILSLIGSI